MGFSECGGLKGRGTRKLTMSDGSGSWVGKEVKMGWALKMKEMSVMCVLYMCHVCVKGKSHWSQIARIVPLATPNSAEMWDSVGTEA